MSSKKTSKNISSSSSSSSSSFSTGKIAGNEDKIACICCCDDFKPTKIIKCPYCHTSACQKCTSKWLLELDDPAPRCLNMTGCKKIWKLDFVAKISPSFDDTYRDRRTDIYCQREKSLFPVTQELVRKQLEKEQIKKQIEELQEEVDLYEALLEIKKARIRDLRLKQKGKVQVSDEKKQFIRKCPVSSCNGYLTTHLKCGMCDGYACKHCHMPKKEKHDSSHVCDKEAVESIKLIKSETRPCPKCSTPIYKLSGCDQMYCTMPGCNTAFSWIKGTIVRGQIHNPHALEMRRIAGNLPRADGDIPCGGIPHLWQLTDRITTKCRMAIPPTLNKIHYIANHIQHDALVRFPAHTENFDHSDLRVDYMLKRIDDKTFKSRIKQRVKKQEKSGEINQVLHMCVITMSDIFRNIFVATKKNHIEEAINQLNAIRDYTNEQLESIGDRFNNVVPGITKKWDWFDNNKNQKVKVSKPINRRRHARPQEFEEEYEEYEEYEEEFEEEFEEEDEEDVFYFGNI